MSKRNRPRIIRFNIGDRVAEKPKDNYISGVARDKTELVKLNSTQRIGTITALCEKQDSRKHTYVYYDVLWDNKRSSQHAQFRLCHEHELNEIVKSYRNNK